MLDPWNSSAPCLLIVSIGALGAVNLSNTRAMSYDILNKASIGSLGTLLSEGLEANKSFSLGLTHLAASSGESIYTKHKDICKTREIPISGKKGKIVISITKLSFRLKIHNLFSRSRMMK